MTIEAVSVLPNYLLRRELRNGVKLDRVRCDAVRAAASLNPATGCLCLREGTGGLLLDVHHHRRWDHPGALRRRRQFRREGALGSLEGLHVRDVPCAGDLVAAKSMARATSSAPG